MKTTKTTRAKNNRPSKKNVPGSSTKAFTALRSLFIDQLKDIYWAEKALMKSIPKMIRLSSSHELVKLLSDHLVVTRQHVSRLEEIFSVIEEKAAAVKCDGMAGLIREAQGMMDDHARGTSRDAGIIAAAQKVEHYEIATYGTLCALARNLGEEDAAVMLYETLGEEKEADEKLAVIAEDILQEEKKEFALAENENKDDVVSTATKTKKTK